jgi:phage shock protein PspC (stress-responsive transcriptional regulator)
MIFLLVLMWAVLGGIAAGIAFEINHKDVDLFLAVMMVTFAPASVIYVIALIAMLAGRMLVRDIRNR